MAVVIAGLAQALPRSSQLFRTIEYYGLSFSTIKRRVKSQRLRYPSLLYRSHRVIFVFAVMFAAAAGVLSVIALRVHGDFAVVNLAAQLMLFGGLVACGYVMRYFARSADEVLKRSGAPPVVLLRSFSDDSGFRMRRYGLPPWLSFERALGRMLSPFAPFVAIGKPGERLPPIGAARSYENDEAWQTRALELIRSSKLVVILVGNTEGLKWELKRIIDEGITANY